MHFIIQPSYTNIINVDIVYVCGYDFFFFAGVHVCVHVCVCGYDFFAGVHMCMSRYVVMNFLLGYTSIIVTTIQIIMENHLLVKSQNTMDIQALLQVIAKLLYLLILVAKRRWRVTTIVCRFLSVLPSVHSSVPNGKGHLRGSNICFRGIPSIKE